MYKFADLEDQIDYLKNAMKFFMDHVPYGHDKRQLKQNIEMLSALENDLVHFIDEYERSVKEKYALETCSDDSLYMLEAISW